MALMGGDDHLDGNVVFQQAQLFEAFLLFQQALVEADKSGQGFHPEGVETDVAEIAFFLAVTGIGDGQAGEVEGLVVFAHDHLDLIGILRLGGGYLPGQGGDLDVWRGKWGDERTQHLGDKGRFVALNVDHHPIFGNRQQTGRLEDPFTAAGMVRAGHEHGDGKGLGLGENPLIIGGEDYLLELMTLAGPGVDMLDHRFPKNKRQGFSFKTGRGIAGGDDAVAGGELVHGDGLGSWIDGGEALRSWLMIAQVLAVPPRRLST
ncbi:MAG: hypothetical protein FD168_2369 [Desulfobulbaceae bacterium]|nr:MAG: hypothetical protein FD168_2369 [Desulfobulbaceae bacterium]